MSLVTRLIFALVVTVAFKSNNLLVNFVLEQILYKNYIYLYFLFKDFFVFNCIFTVLNA
jgi:hypothetical protein